MKLRSVRGSRQYLLPQDFTSVTLSRMVRDNVISNNVLMRYWKLREKSGYCSLSHREQYFLKDCQDIAIRYR
jgi:hypothetical protein